MVGFLDRRLRCPFGSVDAHAVQTHDLPVFRRNELAVKLYGAAARTGVERAQIISGEIGEIKGIIVVDTVREQTGALHGRVSLRVLILKNDRRFPSFVTGGEGKKNAELIPVRRTGDRHAVRAETVFRQKGFHIVRRVYGPEKCAVQGIGPYLLHAETHERREKQRERYRGEHGLPRGFAEPFFHMIPSGRRIVLSC